MNAIDCDLAEPRHLAELLPLVRAFHEHEGLIRSDSFRETAVAGLLADDRLGLIWVIRHLGVAVGYIAVCFGYAIEFGGRDAFVDEFYLRAESRGRGIGSEVLATILDDLAERGIVAAHLEVAADNRAAKSLYGKAGFVSRDHYNLMSCKLT